MDKIAIISDIHGNITALNAVLNDIKNRNIDRIFCLGDYVTKCVHPDLVIDKVRESCEVVLLGNCDETISKPAAKEKHFWSRDIIGDERAAYLSSLPKSYEFYFSGHLIRLFHASPDSLNKIYNPMISDQDEIRKSLEITDPDELFRNTKFINKTDSDPIPDIVGFGHIHTPFLVRDKNKTIFNPGSVGVPVEMKNGDIYDKTNKFSTISSYTILEGYFGKKDLDSISFNFVRVPYSIETEVEDLKKSDMPNKEVIIRSLTSAIPNNL